MKKQIKAPTPETVSFIKSDKSRIIEVMEVEGKFTLVDVYHRIEVNTIPLASFHPKITAPKTKKEKVIDYEPDEDEDSGKSEGGIEKTTNDPLYKMFIPTPPEKINRAIELMNMRKTPLEICQEVKMQMRTFVKLFIKLKELGRIDAAVASTYGNLGQ